MRYLQIGLGSSATAVTRSRSECSLTPAALPDTVSKVIHCRGGKGTAKPSSSAAPAVHFAESAAELVKNLPLANDGRVRKAPRPARPSLPNPSRVQGRSPAGSLPDSDRFRLVLAPDIIIHGQDSAWTGHA